MKAALLLLLLAVSLTSVPGLAFAQSIGGTTPPALTLGISPQYPRPYDTITITPSSSSFDLSGAKVTFYANGKQVAAGSGTSPTSFTLGGPGSVTTIKVTAVTAGGGSYSASQTVAPAEVDLIAEPAATSHPFYQGGLGVSSQGQVRLIAVPDLRTSSGKRLTDSSLVYTWKLNGQELTDASGIGRSIINMTAPVHYRGATVEVIVTNPDASVVAEDHLTISPVDPIVRIYEDDPLLGVRYDQALGDNFAMTDAEDTFVAVPYNFGSTPDFAWSVDGKQSGTDSSVTLRASGNAGGSASVSVTASLDQLFETATQAVQVAFGAAPSSTGIFGL
jgi:hypothetical protein